VSIGVACIIAPVTFTRRAYRLGTTPLMLAVIIGAAQNIVSKGAKYALFDPCKEAAYIPLDSESKTKGKAAVDVVGGVLGKSGGSIVQQVCSVLKRCRGFALLSPIMCR
jgi:AAA family ATP:ADP antiporter